MNCEEIKISLHDFVDELLEENYKKEIETHLKSCNNCFAEYKKIKKFFEKLKSLPYTIDPPDNLIEQLTEELLKIAESEQREEESKPKVNIKKLKREQAKQEKILKNSRGVFRKSRVTKSIFTTKISAPLSPRLGLDPKKTILTLLPLVLFAVGYFVYDFSLINSPWKVRTITGNVLINGQIRASERWEENESLVTENDSKAVIYVPNTCRIEVDANSFLILNKAKDKGNRIKLVKGSIRIINNNLLPYLAIEIDNSVIHNRGGTIAITIDDNSITSVKVEYGYLEIEEKGRVFFVDEGYTCEIRPNFHSGTPHRIDAPDELKDEIRSLDYEFGGDSSIQKIISIAAESDMLTLLALIPRSSEMLRTVIFNKISAYYPPPAGVTLEGIVKLDPEMIEKWWFEIEWQI
ncbi:MAG: hypothetical protein AB1432_03500 [Bacteroidota bacterium]